MKDHPRRRRLTLFLLVGVALTGAAKKPADIAAAADFAGLTTYAWLEDPSRVKPEGNAVVDGPFIDRAVRAAVDANLHRKGFARVEADPTFYVGYRVDSAGGLSQNRWDVPSKYDIDEPWLQAGEQAQPAPNPAFVPDSGTKYRKRSTLTLDVLDRRGKLIWRESRTSSRGANPHDVEKAIDHSVERLLSGFPPKAGAPGR